MDLNKVMIIGRLTRDPEIRTTPNGTNVASFSVATGFTWTDQQGQKKENTEFHNVVAWRKLAEIIGQYLKKGSQVYLEGRLQTQSWDDKTSGQKRYRTEIVVDNMIMLGRPNTGSGSASQGKAADNSPANSAAPQNNDIVSEAPAQDIQVSDEDMPF